MSRKAHQRNNRSKCERKPIPFTLFLKNLLQIFFTRLKIRHVELTSQDGAGNINPVKTIQAWDIDTVRPTLTLDLSGFGYFNAGTGKYYVNQANQSSVTLSGTCADNWPNTLTVYVELVGSGADDLLADSAVCLDDGRWLPMTFDLSSFDDGPITGQAIIVDMAGNFNNYALNAVKDVVPPAVDVQILTNKTTTRNYTATCLAAGGELVPCEDNPIRPDPAHITGCLAGYPCTAVGFTNSNFPTMQVKLSDASGLIVNTPQQVSLRTRDTDNSIYWCHREYFQYDAKGQCLSTATSQGISVWLKTSRNNNGDWKIPMEVVKDNAGNQLTGWVDIQLNNLPPIIITSPNP